MVISETGGGTSRYGNYHVCLFLFLLIFAVWAHTYPMLITPANKATSTFLVVFFLNCAVCLGFALLFSCMFFFFLLWDANEFFFYTILAAEDSTPFPRLSFALALSSTSRDPISSATLNSCLLCYREVAKSLQEGVSLAIIPPATNLSGNKHGKCSSSFASACILWVCSTTERFWTIL